MMDDFDTGTLAGAGSFRCADCGFAVALQQLDAMPTCPHCGSRHFKRSSMFGEHAAAEPCGTHEVGSAEWLAPVRAALAGEGDHLVYEEGGEVRVAPLADGWTRVGRSLAAHVRLDHPTVSRRHALLHRDEGSVRILDDRSLNGVFLNGERVDWHELDDGDEIVIGRFHLYFISLTGESLDGAPEGVGSAVG